MSKSVLFTLFGCLVLSSLQGCADTEEEAAPVMNAMDSFEELAKETASARKKAEAESAQMEEHVLGSPEAPAKVPPGIPTTGKFVVDFTSTSGDFTIEVDRSWAPVGAHRFYELVKDGFFNEAGFFRVVPGFMVQFGLAASPKMTAKWDKEIQDDPVLKSNLRGYVTFAKTNSPNSRSSQIFINFDNNSNLDGRGFAPFGRVTKGMNSVDQISSKHGESPNQGALTARGNSYLKSSFPDLDYVKTATMVVDDLPEPAASN